MIEILKDMPKGVVGLRVSGRLLGDDLREFKPTMEEMLKTGEIRIVEVIASDYEGFGPGGLIEDLEAWLRLSVATSFGFQAHRGCVRQRMGRPYAACARVDGSWRARSIHS